MNCQHSFRSCVREEDGLPEAISRARRRIARDRGNLSVSLSSTLRAAAFPSSVSASILVRRCR